MSKYLKDKWFLKQLDKERYKTQYIRLSVLDFKTEVQIASLEGKATGGTINLSGTSNMRRTMSCSLLVDPEGIEDMRYENNVSYYNVTEVENIISMNKKVYAYVGIKNIYQYMGPEYYPEHDIIWFPLGKFVIKTASVSKNNSGINISLTLSDKTALLNGDMGGTIPASTEFSKLETFNADGTHSDKTEVLIKDIIKHLVIDFGGESPENVIITDIPDQIRRVVKWTGKDTLYLYKYEDSVFYDTSYPNGATVEGEFFYGQDVGYVNHPFVYPGELSCNAGETVANVLDKVKNALGNFEWFYDIDGRFIFQKKKNYIDTSAVTEFLNLSEQNYLSVMNMSKSIYSFDEDNRHLITSISNNPQYQNIKNDLVVWGMTKTATGNDKPIHYHLAFDKKPEIRTEPRPCIVYTDYRGLQQAIVLNNNYVVVKSDMDLDLEDRTKYYFIKNENKYDIYYWDEENSSIRHYPEWELCYLQTDDWRTELYFLGLENSNKTFNKNYYAAELNLEWPKIYDIKKVLKTDTKIFNEVSLSVYEGGYRDDIEKSNYEYFLDFIEGSESGSYNLSQFNVENIGRRVKISNDKTANCIFPTEIPEYLIIAADGNISQEEVAGGIAVNVYEHIYNQLVTGGNRVSAYEKIKELLVQHTNFNESVTLSVIPIYYLEPNSRITIEDNETGVHGDYIINTISLPLTLGTSNISCVRCIEKTI